MTLRGDVTFGELRDSYYGQARALVEGGVDLLLFETAFDTRNLKAGLLAIQKLERYLDQRIPLMVSATIERWGTMLAGQAVDAFYVSVAHVDLVSIGLNCATGPELMTDPLRTLAQMASTRISCHPNAGLPDDDGKYLRDAGALRQTAREVRSARLAEHRWRLLRHDAGTHPSSRADGSRSSTAQGERTGASRLLLRHRARGSGENNRPLIVGERTNVIGSRQFKQLIAEEKCEEASEIARAQVKRGAQIIDVCLQPPTATRPSTSIRFYAALMPKIRVPLMIDSTDPVASSGR